MRVDNIAHMFCTENFFFLSLIFLVGLKRAKATPVYTKAWFLTVVALVAYIALLLVAFILVKKYRHGRVHKYNGM